MVDYNPARFRILSKDEWTSALEAGAPRLPWTGSQGQQIRSFMLVPIPECSAGTTIVFMDAQGMMVDVRHDGTMYRTAEALNPLLGELTLLPDPLE